MKLTFPGDHTAYDENSYIGTQYGDDPRFFRPVAAEYDEAADRTTITYARVPLGEMPTRYGHLIDLAHERLAISDAFGTAS